MSLNWLTRITYRISIIKTACKQQVILLSGYTFSGVQKENLTTTLHER